MYFADTVLQAQDTTKRMIEPRRPGASTARWFVIQKTKLYDRVKSQLNHRQEKALARIFREGIENYISITGASRAMTTRDLQDLVEKGVLSRSGTLKSTRYHLKLETRN